MTKILMKGNEAIGAAAIAAGCRYFFGYPITPQSELPEYMSRELPKVGGVFLQAESEIAAINMVYGAAGTGARVMTSSSSPGFALKQEGMSYIAGAELPALICNVMRGGPGLGSIQPSQTDYYMVTRGGGNGDYRTIALAPASVQELVDMIIDGFDLADKYRNPVVICADGMLGQMMEPVEFKKVDHDDLPEKPWATTGTGGKRPPNIINSLYLQSEKLEQHNLNLIEKYKKIEENEIRYDVDQVEDADFVLTAFGTTSRIVRSAVAQLREEGYKVGIVRPQAIWPFPHIAYQELPDTVKGILTVEMNHGQMIDDVRIAVAGKIPVYHYGRYGGMIPLVEDIVAETKRIMEGQ